MPSAPAGELAVPGSKSIGNRALLLAGAAIGTSRLAGLSDSDDARAAKQVLAALGVVCREEGDCLTVAGAGLDFPVKSGAIDIGSSGTVGRFLPGLLAAAPRGEWLVSSTPQLAARPLRPLLAALKAWDAGIEQPSPDRSFPLRVRAGGLAGGRVEISASSSSQFASGLLIAAPLCAAPATIGIRDLDPDETYVDMTLDLMRVFGVEARAEKSAAALEVSVDAPQPYRAVDMTIEADFNTANYFLALAALGGGSVTITNIGSSSRQPGLRFLDVFRRLGCAVEATERRVTVTGNGLPLRGGFAIDMRAMAEMAPTLAAMAVFADAPVSMTNLAHIRGHESDRLAALAAILGDLGVETAESPDGLVVTPAPRENIRQAAIDPRDDHRLAMSFAVLGAAANGVVIRNPSCVNKTCPEFFRLLRGLGVPLSYGSPA